MRFACPTSVSNIDVTAPMCPNVGKPTNRGNDAPTVHRKFKAERAQRRKRTRPPVAPKQDAVQMALEYSFVYVGNIDPSISQAQLETLFGQCGTITRIQRRCSRGQAVTFGVAVPAEVRTSRDRQYATVEFLEPKAAWKALKLDGYVMDGYKLVVSVSPADLPEVQDIVTARLKSLRERETRKNPFAARPGPSRPVQLEKTEPIIGSTPPPDRHRLFGISFAKCVA
ncbi:hypothetical protein BD779DRAFT_1667452 [Infundibulicybe gibba]|nr:hypothetical protein BD779DRAFT_1667452 [Infundibulicybe gibba]